jgi:hypothetical protein
VPGVATIDTPADALLLQTAQVAALGTPENEQLETLQGWLRHKAGGNLFQRGVEQRIWDSNQRRDFVDLLGNSSNDGDIATLFKPLVDFIYLMCIPEERKV